MAARFAAPNAYNLEVLTSEERDRLETENSQSVEAAIELINGTLSEWIAGKMPSSQDAIDSCITYEDYAVYFCIRRGQAV